jgi:2-C-methyl-D-erythritol 2,4-cyclodiphosphate synthase
MSRVRVGQGFDVHRFRAGRPLRLCGVILPGEIGLDGHSDADVALHAVADAVLGAVGAGDIGDHFPPGDPLWSGADSRDLVGRVLFLARELGWRLVNCDLTIVGERPRVAPHRVTMRAALAACLELPEAAVNVKATTTEGMGWTGRGEGLAALAVVLVEAAHE